MQDFLAAVEVMKNLNHPNLLQLYGVCSQEESMYIISEPMKHGSLLEYLRSGDGRHLRLNQMVDIMAQIAAGECVLTYPSKLEYRIVWYVLSIIIVW